jgi:hypothetical protein
MTAKRSTDNVRMRKRIAKGIYRDQWGLAAIVKVRGQQREKRFPPDTSLKTVKDWRDETKVARSVSSRISSVGGRSRIVVC